jgi:hypothetical protein
MRLARVLVSLVMWMAAAALAGCSPAGRVASESTADTVATTTTTITDTVGDVPVAQPEPEPNDCRYIGSRRYPRQGEPGHGEPYDSVAMANGVPFRCRLRPEGPEARLVVGGASSIPMGFHVYLPADAAEPVQTLPLDNDQPAIEGSGLLVGEDLNGDGWMDLNVYTFSGTGGQMSDVFRFDPAARRFVADTVLPGTNVRRLPEHGCVRTSDKMGAWSVTSADYCWRSGSWVLTSTYAQEPFRDLQVIRTLSERHGGRMQLVRVDTVLYEEPHW